MASRGAKRVGLVLGGFAMGILGVLLGIWFYVEAARVEQIRTGIGDRLRIERDAIERIRVVDQGSVRFRLRGVAILDERGDTIMATPRLTVSLDVATLEGEGPIELYDVVIADPVAYVIQEPDGEWNYLLPFAMTVDGQPVEMEPGRGLVFRNVRITDGRLTFAIPADDDPREEESILPMNLPLTTIGGVPYHEFQVSDIQSVLSQVRIGGPQGWRVDIASFTGEVERPEIEIAELAGWVEQEGEDGARFQLTRGRVGESVFAGEGTVTFTDDRILYSVDLTVDPLRFADIQPIFPTLDREGVASFGLGIESLAAGRTVLSFSALDFEGFDSRILGDVEVAVGGDVGFTLLDADLELAPLQVAALERLGLVSDPKIAGQITGRVSGQGAAVGRIAVDIRTSLTPVDDPGVPPSILYAAGAITVGAAFDAMRLDGVDVGMQPLYPALFRSVFPEFQEQLTGRMEGSVALSGTVDDIRFSDGIVIYEVGEAPSSRLTGLNGRVVVRPELSYEFDALVAPLSLATLTELFPALPFRSASVMGPVEISGSASGLTATADLDGTAGGIEFSGSLAFGEPLRFAVEGSVEAFVAEALIEADVPIDGPVTGTFALDGTTENLDFDVDLAQGGGRAVLAGTLDNSTDPPTFEVAGDITNFRIGTFVGEPGLFVEPMTGAIDVRGGGGAPYVFDVDLTGEVGRLVLDGFYRTGAVPEYEAVGQVAGLDISRLPLPNRPPPSSITGAVELRGRGLNLETLEGTFEFDATNSTVAGIRLDDAFGSVAITDGVAIVDTLLFRFEESRLAARGRWGLLAPATEPLSYAFESPDLSSLDRLFGPTELGPPRLAGSVRARGTVGGSVEYPIIETALTGGNLRYRDYAASALSLNADVRRTDVVGWEGRGTVEGSNLQVPGLDSVQELRLTVDGTQDSFAFGVAGSRDADTDLAAAGVLALDGVDPVEIYLEAMNLRLADSRWELQNPSRIRITDTDGLLVEDLVLQRAGDTGRLAVSGVIPRSGNVDLRVSAADLDLADMRRITELAPEIAGSFDLEAQLIGPVGNPDVSIAARVEQLEYEDAEADLVIFDGVLSGQRLVGTAEVTGDGLRLFQAELEVPMRLSLADFSPSFELLRNDPVNVTAVADSLPMEIITTLIPGVSNGEGVVRAEIDVTGTLDQPALAGSARLVDGALTVDSLNVRYSGITGEIALTQNSILIQSLTIRSGGTLNASGSIDFIAAQPARIAVNVSMNEFEVIDDPDVAEAFVSAELSLNGPASGPVLTGWMELFDSTIRIPELSEPDPLDRIAYLDVGALEPGITEVDPPTAPLFANVLIDGVELRIDESVVLESEEMRVQISGDLVLYRAGEDLRVFGALDVVRGTYTVEVGQFTREFDVTSGRVQFFGTGDINPSLDITAEYPVLGRRDLRTGDLTVFVRVGGTLLAPTVELASNAPVPLPESDLVSYLLFGQPSFNLEGGLGQVAAQEFFGSVLANQLQRPLLDVGLCDWVRVQPGSVADLRSSGFADDLLTGAAIECVRELTSDLYFTARTGLGFLGDIAPEWRVSLDWQIDRQWSWTTSYGEFFPSRFTRYFDTEPRRQLSTDIRRQWEYGRPSTDASIDLLREADPSAPLLPATPGDTLNNPPQAFPPPADSPADTAATAAPGQPPADPPANAPVDAPGALRSPVARTQEGPRTILRGPSR